jgi:hypothetical protein
MWKRLAKLCATILCALLLSVPVFAADKPITKLDVKPAISLRPTDVHYRVWVPKNENNRNLRVELTGNEFYTSHDIQLDGEQAPGVIDAWFKDVPCGNFVFVATVERILDKPYVLRSSELHYCISTEGLDKPASLP